MPLAFFISTFLGEDSNIKRFKIIEGNKAFKNVRKWL